MRGIPTTLRICSICNNDLAQSGAHECQGCYALRLVSAGGFAWGDGGELRITEALPRTRAGLFDRLPRIVVPDATVRCTLLPGSKELARRGLLRGMVFGFLVEAGAVLFCGMVWVLLH